MAFQMLLKQRQISLTTLFHTTSTFTDLVDELQVLRSMEARLNSTEDQVKKLQNSGNEGK